MKSVWYAVASRALQALGGGRLTDNKKGRRPTLHDVARTAGVSVMTVSNVVRGKSHAVKLETRRSSSPQLPV